MGQRLLFCVWMMQASYVSLPTHPTFLEETGLYLGSVCFQSVVSPKYKALPPPLRLPPEPFKVFIVGVTNGELDLPFICIQRSMWSYISDRVHILHNYFCPAVESGGGQDPELLMCCWHVQVPCSLPLTNTPC